MTTTDHGTIPDGEPLAAATDLATALRELIELSVVSTVAPGEVRAVAELVRAASERLAVARRPVSQLPALGGRAFDPVGGEASALAPPLVMRREEGGVVGEATLGIAYEGPPTYVHGGVSALLMDSVLANAAAAAGVWGMTAHLELDYRGPLPIGLELVFRARVAESSGRKSHIVGTIALASAPDQVLVEARGLFIIPRQEKVDTYFGGVTDASGGRPSQDRAGDATAVAED